MERKIYVPKKGTRKMQVVTVVDKQQQSSMTDLQKKIKKLQESSVMKTLYPPIY